MRSGATRIRLPFRRPFDWSSLIAFLAARATPGVEAVDGDSYRRTVSLGGCEGTFEVRRTASGSFLILHIDFPDREALPEIVARVRHLFDLDADPRAVSRHLKRDPRLASWIDRYPGLRVPGAWDGFELSVRAVLGQQVSVQAATTLAGRLARSYGKKMRHLAEDLNVIFPSAEAFCRVEPASLGGLGIPRSRAQAILLLADSVCRREIVFDKRAELETFVRQVTRVPGIGEWTAQYVAMRGLGLRDAFPGTDLGLLRGASNGSRLVQPKTLLRRAEKWRPFRAYAAMYLWKRYGMKVSRTEREP